MKIYYSEMTMNADDDAPAEEYVGDATTVYETMEVIKADYARRMLKVKDAWAKVFPAPWPGSVELKNCMINVTNKGNQTIVTTGSDVSLYVIKP